MFLFFRDSSVSFSRMKKLLLHPFSDAKLEESHGETLALILSPEGCQLQKKKRTDRNIFKGDNVN